ncbi:MAG: hypothetical protein A2W91_20415 [Bacteroidetes bacterium GWF2_38_335]|nr:MAG: hypothetical protein A2W91_20415 [Bacteroidetes bacterium GWF2_38_335]OFY79477.1 MAG: hypothetical protein A2281_13670 [Bacteroidetes bacterium RIFOXYA12_FULL_38_20]HBS86586.1 hypothetical protein [Bacteroidales bacterium]
MKRFKKILKWFVIVLFVLIALIIATPFIFKGKIIEMTKEEINNNLNAKVDFGDFDLTIFSTFPDLKFVLHDLVVVGINEFEGDTLAYIENLELKLDVFSVMGDNIKIQSVVLNNPIVLAKVLANGKANWDIAKPAEERPDEEESNFAMRLDNVEIHGGKIVYDDKSLDYFMQLDGFELKLAGDMVEDITTLNIAANADKMTMDYGGMRYVNEAALKIAGDIDADLAAFKFTFKETDLALNKLEFGVNGFFAMPDNGYDMDLAFNVKKNDFKNFLSMVPALYMNDFESLQTAGKLEFSGSVKGLYSDNTMPGFNLDLKIDQGMFKYPDLPGAANNINVDLSVKNSDGVEDHTVVDLKKMHVDFAGSPIDARLLVMTPVSDPQLEGWLKGAMDLANLKDVVQTDMAMVGNVKADVEFNGRMSSIDNEKYEEFLSKGIIDVANFEYKSEDLPQGIKISKTSIEVSPQYFNLSAFDAIMGKSDLHLSGKIENFLAYAFKGETLLGNFTFNSEVLDLNEFMTSSGTSETAAAETNSSEPTTAFAVPGNIDFVLNSTITKILYEKMEIKDVKGGISLKDSKLSLNDLTMNLLDGSMKLFGSYSTPDVTKPVIDFGMNITNFDIQKTTDAVAIIKELVPIAKNCSGKFSASVDKLTCSLDNTMAPDMKTVNASGSMATKNIQINNSDLFSKIGNLLKSDKFKIIKLDDVKLAFTVTDGNISVQPFETKVGGTKTLIQGKQGIDQSLAYMMKFSIPRKDFGGAANDVLNDLFAKAKSEGVEIPMNDIIDVNAIISGTITNPKISLDLKEQAADALDNIKDQVMDRVNEEVDKAKAEAIKKAEEQAAKLYAEAEKKAAQLVSAAEKTATQIKTTAKQSADKIRSEAKAQSDKLIKEAGNNPVKKKIAQEAGEKLVKEGDKKAKQVEDEGNKQAAATVTKAKTESDNVKAKAKQEGDALIQKAKAS